MIFLGIDPGVSGALAAVHDNGKAFVEDMPFLQIGTRKGKEARTKREVDAQRLADMLHPFSELDVQVAIEKVGAMPGQGVASMFSFGRSTGVVHGVLAALKIPYTLIAPVTWKNAMMKGMGKEKEASVARALQLFPTLSDSLIINGTKKSGRGDALLLAAYLKQIHQG